MNISNLALVVFVLIILSSCGGRQNVNTEVDSRPLEEHKALEIIADLLAQRSYKSTVGKEIQLSNGTRFSGDLLVVGENIAIEYLTELDRDEAGAIPPAEAGSRLHVLPATADVSQDGASPEMAPVYVFLLSEQQYLYQYNPTSDSRADVTLHEVESRLKRDVNDFISWYESKPR